MAKKNIFITADYNEIKTRIQSLTEDNLRQWGSMDINQMLAHCIIAVKNALGYSELPLSGNWFMALGSKWVCVYIINKFPKGLPTSPHMNAKKGRLQISDFKPEQEELLSLLQQIHQLHPKAKMGLHPLFRRMSRKEWGRIIYMHLDHHLRQYAA